MTVLDSVAPERLEGQDLRHVVRESVLTGVALVAPALVTVYLLYLAVGFVFDLVSPLATGLLWAVQGTPSQALVNVGVAVVLVAATVAVGFVARFSAGERVLGYVDGAMMRVPGIGTVYESFRRMSDVIVASDGRNFEAVKLLEMPDRGVYMLGFLVTDSPPAIAMAVEDDLRTLFVPLAPNPVMAGFLVHVPPERVTDVDVSVEEGLSAIVSLGATEAGDVEGPLGGLAWSGDGESPK